MKTLSTFFLLAAVATALSQDAKVTLHVGDPAPPLVIAKWAKGQPVTELGHGKITVVEFWATWCGPCRQSIPHLTELAKKYKGQATFVGVDSFEHVPDPATCYPKVEKFVTEMGNQMNYNVAIDGVDGTMGKTWMEAAGQDGIPTAFVVGRDGKVAWIGHPMEGLDETVGKMVSGTYDEKAEAEKSRLAQAKQQQAAAEQQKMMGILKPVLEARQAKKYQEEVTALDKVMDQVVGMQPQIKAPLEMERLTALSQYDQPAAEKFALSMAESTEYKGNGMALNTLAWAIVQENSPIKHLNPSVGLRIAKAAAVASKYEPNVADTLALAMFRAGMPSDALTTEKAAVDRASTTKGFDANSLEEMKGRLSMYEKAAKASH